MAFKCFKMRYPWKGLRKVAFLDLDFIKEEFRIYVFRTICFCYSLPGDMRVMTSLAIPLIQSHHRDVTE